MNTKLERILKQLKEYERQTPYNYCDRWCRKCDHETQLRCRLYNDELECKLNCIANGRDENDPEITAGVIGEQYKGVFENFEKKLEEFDIDIDDREDDHDEDIQKIRDHIEFVNNNGLTQTSEKYFDISHRFLKRKFYEKNAVKPELKEYFETINWYHSLLAPKVNRALAGFHKPMADGDISLIDFVGQFRICEKAIDNSINALEFIRPLMAQEKEILIMKALLVNIRSRINLLLENL